MNIRSVSLSFALLLSGCMRAYTPDIDFEKGLVQCPDATTHLKYMMTDDTPKVYGEGKYGPISLFLFPISGESRFITVYTKDNLQIDYDSAYYQLNNGNKIKLELKPYHPKLAQFYITPPATMDFYSYRGAGLHVRGLSKIDSKQLKKMREEIYRYHIPLTINKEKCFVDVTFNLDFNSKLTHSFPGSP